VTGPPNRVGVSDAACRTGGPVDQMGPLGPVAVLFGPPVSFDAVGSLGAGKVWVGLGPGQRRSARLGW
jgi:hypothetical protein